MTLRSLRTVRFRISSNKSKNAESAERVEGMLGSK